MSGFGSVSPVRGNQEILTVVTQWTGKGAADLAAVAGLSKMVKSFTYNSATGKFIVTLVDWPGILLDVRVKNHRASGSAPLTGSPVWASVDKTAFTIPVEVWDMATPSLTNPVDGTTVILELVFQKAHANS